MIVDSMTLQEVGEAILKTAKVNIPKIKGMIRRKDKDYRRIIFKGLKDRYDFKPLSFVADGIEFHICPYSLGKKDYKRYGLLHCVFAHIYYKGTNWYCTVSDSFSTIKMYCNHFFERYIERHLKDNSQVNVETVRRYLKETEYLHYIRFINNPKHPNCIYSSTKIGVCCGRVVSKNILAFMTYIDKETLSLGEKKESYNISQIALDTVYMDEKGEMQFGV